MIVVISENYERHLSKWSGKTDSLLMLQQVVGTATTGLWMVTGGMECAAID
jgi:hypothetical protein